MLRLKGLQMYVYPSFLIYLRLLYSVECFHSTLLCLHWVRKYSEWKALFSEGQSPDLSLHFNLKKKKARTHSFTENSLLGCILRFIRGFGCSTFIVRLEQLVCTCLEVWLYALCVSAGIFLGNSLCTVHAVEQGSNACIFVLAMRTCVQ